MTALDRIDFDILAELQNNARISNKELAGRVGLAPSSCLQRVRRLGQAGVVRGYHADIDPAALGIGLEAMVSVRLQQHSLDLVEAFQEHLLSLPEACDGLGIEARECLPVALTLAEDCLPAETGLGSLEDEELEMAPIVVNRNAPLEVMIGAHRVAAPCPRAATAEVFLVRSS